MRFMLMREVHSPDRLLYVDVDKIGSVVEYDGLGCHIILGNKHEYQVTMSAEELLAYIGADVA